MVIEILKKMNLQELIGTEFESSIEILNYKKNEKATILESSYNKLIYIVNGKLRLTIRSPHGRLDTYLLKQDEFIGTGFSSFNLKESNNEMFSFELCAEKGSTIAILPLIKIFKMDCPNKEGILENLIIKISTMNTIRKLDYINNHIKS